jgi:hypothetical protein
MRHCTLPDIGVQDNPTPLGRGELAHGRVKACIGREIRCQFSVKRTKSGLYGSAIAFPKG